MSICNLEQNKELANAIATHINLHIKDKIATGKPFKLLDIVNEVFAAVYTDTKDVNKALGIAGAVPQIFITLIELKSKYISNLYAADKFFKMDPIYAFQNEIETSETPLDVVAKHIKKGLMPTVKQFADNKFNTEPLEKTVLKLAPDLTTVIAKALSASAFDSSTGNSQMVDKNDVKDPMHSNPAKIYAYSALQNLLNAQEGAINFENVKYSGHTGFKLLALKERDLPNPAKNVYSSNKESKSSIVAITDNKGEFLYFNNKGEITTEADGKIAYFSLRKVDSSTKNLIYEGALKKVKEVITDISGNDVEVYDRNLREAAAELKNKII